MVPRLRPGTGTCPRWRPSPPGPADRRILTTNPGRRLERRKPARRGDRSIPRARLDKLLTDDRHGLRERVLWRMLYETAARAGELLSLNVEDLDLEFRRGRVTSKGGAVEYVHWAAGTGRLLRGRTSGPVFLAGRRAPCPVREPLPRRTSARRPDAAGCPTRAPARTRLVANEWRRVRGEISSPAARPPGG
jgi:integrase